MENSLHFFGSTDVEMLLPSLLLIESSDPPNDECHSPPDMFPVDFFRDLLDNIQKTSWTAEPCKSSGLLWVLYEVVRQYQEIYLACPLSPLYFELLHLCSDFRNIRALMACLFAPSHCISKLLALSLINSLLPESLPDCFAADTANFKVLSNLCRNNFGVHSPGLLFHNDLNLAEVHAGNYPVKYKLYGMSDDEAIEVQKKCCQFCLTIFEKLITEGVDLDLFWAHGCMDTVLFVIMEFVPCRNRALRVVATFVMFSGNDSHVSSVRGSLEPYSLSVVFCDFFEEMLDAFFYAVIVFCGGMAGDKSSALCRQVLRFIKTCSVNHFSSSLDLLECSPWYDNLVDTLARNIDLPVFAIIPLRLSSQSEGGLARLRNSLRDNLRSRVALEKSSAMGCRVVNYHVTKLFCALNYPVVNPLSPSIMEWTLVDLKRWLSLIGTREVTPGFNFCYDVLPKKHSPRFFNELVLRGSITELHKILMLNITLKCQFSRFRKEVEFLRRWSVSARRHDSSESSDLKSSTRLSVSDDNLLECRNGSVESAKSAPTFSDTRLLFFEKPPTPFLTSTPNNYQYFDVFISYRRDYGSHIASLLHCIFKSRGIKSFLDVTTLSSGSFRSSIVESIGNSRNFVAILSRNSLDRCYGDVDIKDYFHLEIRTAIENKKNVIPIFLDFNTPDPHQLPQIFGLFLSQNGVTWNHEYQDASVEKVISFLLPLSDSQSTPLSV